MSESFDNDVYERALASGESEKSARARATSYNSDKRSKVQYFRRERGPMTDIRIEASGDLRLSKERQEAMTLAARLIGLVFRVDIHGVFLNAVRDDPKTPYGVNIVFVQKMKP